MKIHNFLAATLLGALVTSVTQPSLATEIQSPGSACTFIDLNGWLYYVNNATQHISYAGPLLTNNSGSTLWATCPLAVPYNMNFNVAITHSGSAPICNLCSNNTLGSVCYTMPSYGPLNNGSGLYYELTASHLDSNYYAWNIQCRLPTGNSVQIVQLNY